jgi:hypothetical protein
VHNQWFRKSIGRSELISSLIDTAQDEMENTEELIKNLSENDSLYIWWHPEVKLITRDVFIRKMQMIKRHLDCSSYVLWSDDASKTLDIRREYKEYIDSLKKEPKCLTV